MAGLGIGAMPTHRANIATAPKIASRAFWRPRDTWPMREHRSADLFWPEDPIEPVLWVPIIETCYWETPQAA